MSNKSLPTLRLSPEALREVARRIAARGIDLGMAQRIVMRDRPTSEAATNAPIKLSVRDLVRGFLRQGYSLENAGRAALQVMKMRDEAKAPASGELEPPFESAAQEMLKESGGTIESCRSEVMRLFPAARRKTLPVVASEGEPSDAPSTAPSQAAASPTQDPTGTRTVASDAPLSIARLARQIARRKGVNLEFAQQLADRQIRAQRRGGGK